MAVDVFRPAVAPNSLTFPTWAQLVVALVLGLVSVFFLLRKTASEPYVFSHEELNAPANGASPSRSTEWMNMGFWKDTDDFSSACEALAMQVFSRALRPNGSTLDVAFGSGDSLVLLRTHPDLPRQSRIDGITSLQPHAKRAAVRMSQMYPRRGEEVSLHQGDAVFRAAMRSKGPKIHPLDPRAFSEGVPQYDSVTCIDAAYHFQTREVFLAQVFDALVDGGTVVLADQLSGASYPTSPLPSFSFVSSPSPPSSPTLISRLALSLLLPLLSVPTANIIPISSMADILAQIGFVDIEIVDISSDVYPGFSRFLSGRGKTWRLVASVASWWHRRGLLRFCIVQARKPATETS